MTLPEHLADERARLIALARAYRDEDVAGIAALLAESVDQVTGENLVDLDERLDVAHQLLLSACWLLLEIARVASPHTLGDEILDRWAGLR